MGCPHPAGEARGKQAGEISGNSAFFPLPSYYALKAQFSKHHPSTEKVGKHRKRVIHCPQKAEVVSSNLAGSAIYDVNLFAATLARLGLEEMAVPRLALCRVPAVRHQRRGPQAFAAVASREVERGRQQSRGSLSGCGPSSCRPERASRPVRRGNPYLAVGGAAHDLALSDSTVKGLLAGRAIVYVGTISYSLYGLRSCRHAGDRHLQARRSPRPSSHARRGWPPSRIRSPDADREGSG
jgi:hypothetical protein